MLKGKNLAIQVHKVGNDYLVQVTARGLTSGVVNFTKKIEGAGSDPSLLAKYTDSELVEDLKKNGAYVAERVVGGANARSQTRKASEK